MTAIGDAQHRMHLSIKVPVHDKAQERGNQKDTYTLYDQINVTS